VDKLRDSLWRRGEGFRHGQSFPGDGRDGKGSTAKCGRGCSRNGTAEDVQPGLCSPDLSGEFVFPWAAVSFCRNPAGGWRAPGFGFQFGFNLRDGGKAGNQPRGKGTRELIFRNADRLVDAAQGVLSDDAVAFLAENEADRGSVGGMAKFVIQDVEVEVHFAGVLGLEVFGFEVDDDEAAEVEVVEKEVDGEVFAGYVDAILAADEGEALAELEKEFFDMVEELGFEFALVEGFFEGEEVEDDRGL
jgi:hypothetical protein